MSEWSNFVYFTHLKVRYCEKIISDLKHYFYFTWSKGLVIYKREGMRFKSFHPTLYRGSSVSQNHPESTVSKGNSCFHWRPKFGLLKLKSFCHLRSSNRSYCSLFNIPSKKILLNFQKFGRNIFFIFPVTSKKEK